MIAFPLEVPEHSGEALLAPRGVDLLDLARANRSALDAAAVVLSRVPLREWRARVRAELLPAAREYTAALGMSPPPEGDLLLATGHQPVFAHPGIWVKYLLLDRLARAGHTGVAVAVDSDAMEDLGADVPVRSDGRLGRRHETLRRAQADEPYEARGAPSTQEWEEFLSRVDHHLQTLAEAEVHAPWDTFRRQPRPQAATLTAFLLAVRRRHEGPRRFLDLPVSRMAESAAFRAFFLHIGEEAARFAAVHNRHLRAYRSSQHIRTGAQPFPDLDVTADLVELPFWSVAEGRREPLFLSLRDRTLSTPTRTLGPLPGDADGGAWGSLGLRPRALTLTAFLRVFLSDLFIHGVGGARYDRVTDAVIGEFLEIAPPAYAAASATLHLLLEEAADPPSQRATLARQIQEARHNPERLLHDPNAEQAALIDEKWRLIRRLEAPYLSRAQRRETTQRIRQINERLSAALAASLAEKETALASLAGGPGSPDAATYRGYPFFLFSPEAMEPLVDAMVG